MAIREVTVGQKYLAHSEDQKPLVGVSIGAYLREYNTGKEFVFNGEQWHEKTRKKAMYKWLEQSIAAGSFFGHSIPVEEFDLITAFASSNGSVQVSFRVTDDTGTDYAWDPLGVMNGASQRASSQAQISGMSFVKIIVTNSGVDAVTASIYAYLGRKS
jgi:hypothetical protein